MAAFDPVQSVNQSSAPQPGEPSPPPSTDGPTPPSSGGATNNPPPAPPEPPMNLMPVSSIKRAIIPLLMILFLGGGLFATMSLSRNRQQTGSKASTGNVNVSLTTQNQTVLAGSTFSTSIQIATNGSGVTAAELHLSYPSDKLEATAITGSSFLPVILTQGSVGPGTASITLGVATGGLVRQPQTGELATVTFRALTSGNAQIQFDPTTQVAVTGQTGNYLGTTSPLSITISGTNGDQPPPGPTCVPRLPCFDDPTSTDQVCLRQKQLISPERWCPLVSPLPRTTPTCNPLPRECVNGVCALPVPPGGWCPPTQTGTASVTFRLKLQGVFKKGFHKTAAFILNQGNEIKYRLGDGDVLLTSDENGVYSSFTFQDSIQAGIYDISIKVGTPYLKKVFPSITIQPGNNIIDLTDKPFLAGDINGDGRIDALDIGLLAINYFKEDEGASPSATPSPSQ